jgi:hypothetical protein
MEEAYVRYSDLAHKAIRPKNLNPSEILRRVAPQDEGGFMTHLQLNKCVGKSVSF